MRQVTSRQFYDEFCQRTGTRPEYNVLAHAAGAIFKINSSITPVVAQLFAAGHRLGLLSNTCEMHWDYFADGRYSLVPEIFESVILSFRVGAMKPDAKIYAAAADAAHVRPEEIFFTDDTPGHVAAAREFGFDAVNYTDTPTLVRELRKRNVQFNY
jgi:FMN phosphatase YigB (HAD superfamily)